MLIQSQKYSVSSKGTLGGLQGVKPGWTTFMYFVLEGWNFDMWCKSDSYKTFIIDTFAHFAQKKIYRPLFEKTDFVALIRPHRVVLCYYFPNLKKTRNLIIFMFRIIPSLFWKQMVRFCLAVWPVFLDFLVLMRQTGFKTVLMLFLKRSLVILFNH